MTSKRNPARASTSIATRLLALAWILAAAAGRAGAQTAGPAAAPNLLLVMADDLGYGDPGCYNPDSRVATPHIDRLASEGLRFTDAHAPAAVCVPTRYGLLTGRYPFRRERRRGPLIGAGQTTIASFLRAHGYATACVGKWHLGFESEKDPATGQRLRGGPLDCGFESYFGIPASLDIPPYYYIEGDRCVAAPSEHVEASRSEGWSPIQGAFWRAGGIAPGFRHADVLPRVIDRGLEFLRATGKREPFFLYVALPAPHTPWLPGEEFRGTTSVELYGDFVHQVDHGLGRLLGTLEERDLANDTIVIFTSDNGPVWYGADTERFAHSSTGPLRGMKGDSWEGGHRVPFLVRWPGTIPAGTVSDALLGQTDLLATLAGALGAALPAGARGDGVDLSPVWRGETERRPAGSPLVHESSSGTLAIREGPWKLIPQLGSAGFSQPRREDPAPGGPQGQLYNLEEDLGETENLYGEHPGIVARLESTLARLQEADTRPLALHPDNPHYFLFRGEPTVLITSGEHYGALLNLDFDYEAYFETLAAASLNGTRTFSGVYVETSGNFGITDNTLDPAAGRFICPWARSDVDGYADGGNKFDLGRWDERYFERLRELVAAASRHGVIVELVLFCPFYGESQWRVSPLHPANNVNGFGAIERTEVYTVDRHGGLLAVQEAMVRRMVAELRGFDNVYLEICNEPYAGNLPLAWEHHVADVIVEAQREFPHPLLISRNVSNGSARVEEPHPAVSILNFHYAAPPDAVALNYHLDRVIGDNETGFRGTANHPYRMEAWDFIIAGGGLFNHLDYSFSVAHPRGTWTDYPDNQPGGGNPTLREQFRILREFIYGFDFLRMRPDSSVITGAPANRTARALVAPGEAYAIYLRERPPAGSYSVRWRGAVVPRFSETYTFHTVSNDGVRLWIDGEPVIDNWTDHSATEDTGTATLEAARSYPLRLEYFYTGGDGTIRLFWSSPSQEREPVPESRLRLPGGDGAGLAGAYFRGSRLEDPWRDRTDGAIDFAWGSEPPFVEGVVDGEEKLEVALPAGSYRAEWVDTKNGGVVQTTDFVHREGSAGWIVPRHEHDIALRILARGDAGAGAR